MRRRARIVQIAHDLTSRPFDQLRVLDLASLEGHFSFEFAGCGAQVLGVEGRKANVEKSESERQRLGFNNVEFVHDDVRNLSAERYGKFDIVLCLGIAYHLDAPDVFKLFERVYEVCTDFAIVDTHVGVQANRQFTYGGRIYSGWDYREGEQAHPWSSIANSRSFWLTRPSLYNALSAAGFSSVLEAHSPAMNDMPGDRVTLIAMKRAKVNLFLTPLPELEWREPHPEIYPNKPVSWSPVSSPVKPSRRQRLRQLLG